MVVSLSLGDAPITKEWKEGILNVKETEDYLGYYHAVRIEKCEGTVLGLTKKVMKFSDDAKRKLWIQRNKGKPFPPRPYKKIVGRVLSIKSEDEIGEVNFPQSFFKPETRDMLNEQISYIHESERLCDRTLTGWSHEYTLKILTGKLAGREYHQIKHDVDQKGWTKIRERDGSWVWDAGNST